MADGDAVNLTLPSSFWKVTLGNVLTMLCILGGFFAFFLGYDHQIIDNRNLSLGTAKDVTAFVAAQTETNRVINDRLNNIEAAARKLERIDEKLNWIQDWIKEQKQQRTVNP